MKDTAIPAKNVAIQEVGLDKLVKGMSDWWNRIAQRAYEFFAASGFTNGHDLDDWLKAEQEMLQPVNVDVKESGDEFIVNGKVPGFEAKDLRVHVNGSRLVIHGKHETAREKKEKGVGTTHSERQSREIYRMVELPAPVLADKARAALKNDVLEVKLPKAAQYQQAKIAAA